MLWSSRSNTRHNASNSRFTFIFVIFIYIMDRMKFCILMCILYSHFRNSWNSVRILETVVIHTTCCTCEHIEWKIYWRFKNCRTAFSHKSIHNPIDLTDLHKALVKYFLMANVWKSAVVSEQVFFLVRTGNCKLFYNRNSYKICLAHALWKLNFL